MIETRRRFVCDCCGKVSKPNWGYPQLFRTEKVGGWLIYHQVRRPLPGGNTETTFVDLCPKCARKVAPNEVGWAR